MSVEELVDVLLTMPPDFRDHPVVGWVSPTMIAELEAVSIETEQTVLYFGPPRPKI